MATPSISAVQVETRDDITLVMLTGDLGAASAPALIDRLEALQSLGSTIVLDLRNVTFVDPTGVDLLLGACDSAQRQGQRVVCIGVSSAVRGAIAATGTKLIDEEPDPVLTLLAFTRADRGMTPFEGRARA